MYCYCTDVIGRLKRTDEEVYWLINLNRIASTNNHISSLKKRKQEIHKSIRVFVKI